MNRFRMLYIVIFFFKQKTAYEMRISDWSSDVCSSDLHLRRRKVLRNVVDHPADTGAADLLVVGKGDVDRLLERPRLEFGHQRQRGGEEGLHVAGAAHVELAGPHDHVEGGAAPRPAGERPDVRWAGEPTADRRQRQT